MKIVRNGTVPQEGVPWGELQPGKVYREVGFTHLLLLFTSGDEMVDLDDGEVFEGVDFEDGARFVEVEVNLVVSE